MSKHEEQVLLQIWSEVLDVPIGDIDVNDNFFLLSGDSLSAMMMCMYVEQRLHRALSLSAFIEDPTIAGITRTFEDPELQRMFR